MASLESSTEDKLANQLDSLTTNPDAQAAAEALAAPLAAEPTGVQSAAAAAAVAEVAASLPSMDFPPEEIRDSPEFVSERETFMVDGARVPDTELVSQWSQMGLKPGIVECLTAKMEPRHTFPFRLHEVALPRILRAEGSTAFIVNAPTGHGKTAAFTLPIMQAATQRPSAASSQDSGPCALVLTKNRELARQHQRKILEYAQGTLDTYADGSRVDPEMPLTSAGTLDLNKLALGDIDSLQVGILVGLEHGSKGGGSKGGGGKGGGGKGGGGKGGADGVDPGKGARDDRAATAQVVVGTITKVLKSLQKGGKPKVDGRGVRVVVFDEVDELLARGTTEVANILACCPNARALFVSATISDEAKETIQSLMKGRNLVDVQTEQKTRAAFQANFLLHPHESKIETMRRINEQVVRTGKKLVFTNTVVDVDATRDKFRLPKEEGGLGMPGTVGVHANSHDGDAKARAEALRQFKEDSTGEFNVCICSDVLSRGINIETITTVVNMDLPEGRESGGGADATTYVHRLGRCTRSETASGLSINVLGGVEEATRDDPTKSARLLQQLKDSREPALEAFGPHYDVPRDIYRDGTEDVPLEMEVKVNEGGKDVWKMLPVQVTRGGADETSWTISFEWPAGTPHTGVPLFGIDAVHAPFDYLALDQEMELFQAKAIVEGALIQAVRTNSYQDLASTVAETRGVIEKLLCEPEDTSQKALAEAWKWRSVAAAFLQRLVKEAIYFAHQKANGH